MLKKRKLKTPKQKAKDAADKWFSLYIRLKYASDTGMVKCYTCDTILHYKSMQNGHFITRSCNTLRFSEKNCRPQCMGCNIFKGGNYIEYTLRLIKEKGLTYVDNLRLMKHEIKQFTTEELKKITKKYKNKVIKMSNYEG